MQKIFLISLYATLSFGVFAEGMSQTPSMYDVRGGHGPMVTDTLNKDKALYNHYKELRGSPDVLNEREFLAKRTNTNYFGYSEPPKGVKESFWGAAGRAIVNFFSNMPFDIYASAEHGGTQYILDIIDENKTLTDQQKEEIKQRITNSSKSNVETALELKNDVTAHPAPYWVDVEDTWQRKLGTYVGRAVAIVVFALLIWLMIRKRMTKCMTKGQ